MFRLLNNYCHIIEKVYGAPAVPISQYESCMNDLSVLAISFPKWFDYTSHTQMENMDDQTRIALVKAFFFTMPPALMFEGPSSVNATGECHCSYTTFTATDDSCIFGTFFGVGYA